MPKTVALITSRCCPASVHWKTLTHLFGNAFDLRTYSHDDDSPCRPMEADLFVISLYQVYRAMQGCIPPGAKVVIINNTITEEQYRKVAALPPGTSALLVNYCVEMTMDTISMFHQLGLNHLELVPCYPGVKDLPRLSLAVTPGELKYVPSFVEQVVNIGDRVMDFRTIVNIATGVGLEHLLKEERFTSYFASIRMTSDSMTSLFDRASLLESQLSRLLDVLDDGILIIEPTGHIHAGNRKARELLGPERDFVGAPAADVIPGIPFAQVFERAQEVDYTLVKIRSQDISVKVVPVIANGETQGALAILDVFQEKEKSQHRLRSQLLGKGHRSRYTFDSILTQDPAMAEIKELARQKAQSSASVLILGETGTGKELFAHAVHAASPRGNEPFVTVNCAALPETLLESELFGYEEGAFTGARKGGKPGLFELAHQGTIFLDEIGEMEMSLQKRLLRVLENREVMRIGGNRMIQVDIRIISATNKDLWQCVEAGLFRKDLYFRLNVLLIEIPPLRDRPGDIPLLLDALKRMNRTDFELTPAALAALLRYPWPGNVRELKNLVDFLGCRDLETVHERDVLPFLKGRSAAPARIAPAPERPPEPHGPSLDGERFILERLYASHREMTRSGRRTLHRQAMEHGLYLSEGQIRSLLVHLEGAGLVQLSVGRQGTTITKRGIDALFAGNRGD